MFRISRGSRGVMLSGRIRKLRLVCMGGGWPLVLLLTQPGRLSRVMVSGGETFTERASEK
jgi:hypothetical protein